MRSLDEDCAFAMTYFRQHTTKLKRIKHHRLLPSNKLSAQDIINKEFTNLNHRQKMLYISRLDAELSNPDSVISVKVIIEKMQYLRKVKPYESRKPYGGI